VRGSVAKLLRREAEGDRELYQALKHTHRVYGTESPEPAAQPSRWSRGRQRLGRVTGVHFRMPHPLRPIGLFFLDLNAHDKLSALHLAKFGSTLSKDELTRRVNELKRRAEANKPEGRAGIDENRPGTGTSDSNS
jgi:hypothetical protein